MWPAPISFIHGSWQRKAGTKGNNACMSWAQMQFLSRARRHLYRLGRVVVCISNWKVGSQDPTVAREQRLDFVKRRPGRAFPSTSATSAMYCCWPGRLMDACTYKSKMSSRCTRYDKTEMIRKRKDVILVACRDDGTR